ncbi:hypothetical protein QF035_010897 [Streptomyces umbrinus]|uniref:Uncharacterized protein n=1 Tax=Streptomyces umbrinus TaxID=67370 RepID=A0ABU0TC22_9ACTN|nr:hypothetical protein [Streptomyces umbrinus]MDQ1033315.1 hypothetical protein [Streptomyces umbrinus]
MTTPAPLVAELDPSALTCSGDRVGHCAGYQPLCTSFGRVTGFS